MQANLRENGDLELTADHIERDFIANVEAYLQKEALIGEMLYQRYEFIQPEEIGALTDAPILVSADETWPNDKGERQFAEGFKVFWFPDYAVRDPWEELTTRGRVVFTLHREPV